MKKIITIAFIFLTTFACKTKQAVIGIQNENFRKELTELKGFFHIPALSVIIKNGNKTIFEDYLGFANLKTKAINNSSTTTPIASLTKIFTAVLVMKLYEEGKLDLDEPINKYISNQHIDDSIKIKHVLSHTSQGNIGQNFYYSSRFSWLTKVIEKASGKSFEAEIKEKIIQPLGLKNTYLLSDSLQLRAENRKFSMPYYYEGEIKEGIIEYCFSAAAGITSTVQDLAKLDKAIDNNLLITEASKKKIFTPFKEHLPYGLGIFSQKLQNQDLIWGYGQYDCYSSLYLKIPSKQLTFIVAANNNLMSDPARLIYGDVTYSLVAISFLKNHVLDLSNEPLFEDYSSLNSLERRINTNNSAFYTQIKVFLNLIFSQVKDCQTFGTDNL